MACYCPRRYRDIAAQPAYGKVAVHHEQDQLMNVHVKFLLREQISRRVTPRPRTAADTSPCQPPPPTHPAPIPGPSMIPRHRRAKTTPRPTLTKTRCVDRTPDAPGRQ